SASRSHRNFTCPPPHCFLIHLLPLSAVVGAVENRDSRLFPERNGPVGHVDRVGESVHPPEVLSRVSPAPPIFPTGPSTWLARPLIRPGPGRGSCASGPGPGGTSPSWPACPFRP